jgi:multiple sugar transport system permease protein
MRTVSSLQARSSYNRTRVGNLVLRYGLLILLSILFLLPFYLMVRNGLSTDKEITSFDWIWMPSSLHFENIIELFQNEDAPFATGLQNSFIIATTQTLGLLTIASMGGYALARIPSRWANGVFMMVVLSLLIPGAVTFVPSYLVVSFLGWVDTPFGLIVPGLFSTFATFIFRQFFLNFPRELEDAGRVDGLHYWGVFLRLVIPNSVPIFVALGSITFISSWNAFVWPLIIGQDSSNYTVQVVLSTYLTAQMINLHGLFIGAALSILPLVVLFLILQRYIVEGVKQTGIRG